MNYREIFVTVYGEDSVLKETLSIIDSNGFSLDELITIKRLLIKNELDVNYRGYTLIIKVDKDIINKQLVYNFDILDKQRIDTLNKLLH